MLKVKSLDNKEVEIAERTRKISRGINAAMFDGVDVDMNGINPENMDLKIPFKNIDRANEITVKLLTWLSDAEMDSLSEEDYNLLVNECSKKK